MFRNDNKEYVGESYNFGSDEEAVLVSEKNKKKPIKLV